ncbi:MAG: hypothetical protein ISR65_00575 [Bacteriovoracaceae bacterium]|nr:hypothetical protein [Bacteriovoracaceae bacterium]
MKFLNKIIITSVLLALAGCASSLNIEGSKLATVALKSKTQEQVIK